MDFGQLSIRGFLGFAETEEQRIQLGGRGVVLVEGCNHDDETMQNNGSGKTALIDAPCWCLYGYTTRGYKDDQVIHRWGSKKNCEVTQELLVDGLRYVVVRARASKVYGNRLHLFRVPADEDINDPRIRELMLAPGGVSDYSGKDAKATQEKIDKLLGMNKTSWQHSAVFGQMEVYKFSQLTDGRQKQILDDLLGVERYATACKVGREAASAAEAELRVLDTKVERLIQEIAEAWQRVSEYELAQFSFAEEKERSIKRARAAWREAKEEHETLLARACKLPALRAELKSAQAAFARASRELDAAIERSAQAAADARHAEHAVNAARRALSDVRSDERGICERCGGNVRKHTILTHRAKLTRALLDARHSAGQADMAVKASRSAVEASRSAMEPLQSAMEACQRRLDAARRDAGRLNATADRRKRAAAELRRAKEATAPYASMLQREQESIKAAKRELKHAREKQQATRRFLLSLQYWIEGYGARGLRSDLIASSLPFLNAQAARCAHTLTGGNIKVEFRTRRELAKGGERDEFHVAVDNRHGAADYEGNSGGERGKVDVVVGLALQQLVATRAGVRVPIAWFDEPFDALDDRAADRVATFLADELQGRSSVFVITHKATLKSYFPKSILVEKRGNRCRIVE